MANSTKPGSSPIERLPTEILSEICDMVGREHLPTLFRVSRALSNCAIPRFFRIFHFCNSQRLASFLHQCRQNYNVGKHIHKATIACISFRDEGDKELLQFEQVQESLLNAIKIFTGIDMTTLMWWHFHNADRLRKMTLDLAVICMLTRLPKITYLLLHLDSDFGGLSEKIASSTTWPELSVLDVRARDPSIRFGQTPVLVPPLKSILFVLTRAPKLQELHLTGFGNRDVDFGLKFPSVTKLSISCSSMSEESLGKILDAFPNVNDFKYESGGMRHPELEDGSEPDAWRCAALEVTPAGLLRRLQCWEQQLTGLSLDFQRGFFPGGPGSAIQSVQHFTKLKRLEIDYSCISGNPSVGDRLCMYNSRGEHLRQIGSDVAGGKDLVGQLPKEITRLSFRGNPAAIYQHLGPMLLDLKQSERNLDVEFQLWRTKNANDRQVLQSMFTDSKAAPKFVEVDAPVDQEHMQLNLRQELFVAEKKSWIIQQFLKRTFPGGIINVLQNISVLAASVCSATPKPEARDAIWGMLKYLDLHHYGDNRGDSPNRVAGAIPFYIQSLLACHSTLFLMEYPERFWHWLDPFLAELHSSVSKTSFIDSSYHIAILNFTATLGYGSEYLYRHIPSQLADSNRNLQETMGLSLPCEKDTPTKFTAFAIQLSNATHSMVFHQRPAEWTWPYIHTALALYIIRPEAMDDINPGFPWFELVQNLNSVIHSDPPIREAVWERIEGSAFPDLNEPSRTPLPEDLLIKDMPGATRYLPEEYFLQSFEDTRTMEQQQQQRRERILFLGYQIAELNNTYFRRRGRKFDLGEEARSLNPKLAAILDS